ncbi:XK-related protein 9 isoform X1 [Ornithorhynchus anatinus]|uniref:XK-related protein n=1 Tax=Ornithorhynchus anatinus TaxID=9258 RepID=F7FT32_ORNAN|nr:XK-related protein 9 isoform X1 [Ornithorhynchus anatinus]
MTLSKPNFILLVLGMIIYVADLGVDFWVTIRYFQNGQLVHGFLTMGFVLLASLVVQCFSYTWFEDDGDPGKPPCSLFLHCLQCGIFTRYYIALRTGHKVVFGKQKDDTQVGVQAVTDLSMLRLFEAYVEGLPQLVLQAYILMESPAVSFSQYASVTISCCAVSLTTVDYQIYLRKSLPHKEKLAGLRPKLTLLLYKLLTLTSWALSIALLALANLWAVPIALGSLWILGLAWAWRQSTDFCHSPRMEVLYRAVVGFILVFTFLNVKGERTRWAMTGYYVTRVLATAGILFWFWLGGPVPGQWHFFGGVTLAVILTLCLGLVFLVVYYGSFHPNRFPERNGGDEVDGIGPEREPGMRYRLML